MDEHLLKELIEKYLSETATPEEEKILMNWFFSANLSEVSIPIDNEAEKEQIRLRMRRRVLAHARPAALPPPAVDLPSAAIPAVRPLHFLKTTWFRYSAAAVVSLLALGAGFWFQNSRRQLPKSTSRQLAGDIEPGKPGAILTLTNGSTVVLDSLGNGLVARQTGARLILKDKQLVYDPTGDSTGETAYNTMTTPKGRQFNMILPDGTGVWLNAASSLKYPTVFSGTSRTVEITGEAYFEVVKNARMPFKVKVNDGVAIEVLGTHFNVNAYADENSINTTLLEGSVRVAGDWSESGERTGRKTEPGKNKVVLKPGQQAQVVQAAKHILLEEADTERVMAWKNGAFNFNQLSFEQVMRQLARWYNIEVVYEKGVPNIQFYGKMSRSMRLSNLIKVLEQSEVHFRVEEGRKMIVMP